MVKSATEVAFLLKVSLQRLVCGKLLEEGFYTKLYTKTAVSECSIAFGKLNLTSFITRTISMTQWFSLAPFACKGRWWNFHVLGALSSELIFNTFFQLLGALFFCYAVSSCVYDHNHPYLKLVPERLFLCRERGFSVPAESSGVPAESPGYTLGWSGNLTCGHFCGRRGEAEKPKNQRSLRLGTGRSTTVPIPADTFERALRRHFSVDFQTRYIVGKILSWSKQTCFVFVNRTRNGRTVAVPNLLMHRLRDWPKTEAALQQSYRLSKVRDKRTALEASTWRKNETKCSVFFIFQLGKAKENAKLLTCCLKNSSICKQSSPTTRQPTTKLDFLKSGDLEALKPLPHSTQMPRGQQRRQQQFFWKPFIGGECIAVRNLAHLFIMLMATKHCLSSFNFCLGT